MTKACFTWTFPHLSSVSRCLSYSLLSQLSRTHVGQNNAMVNLLWSCRLQWVELAGHSDHATDHAVTVALPPFLFIHESLSRPASIQHRSVFTPDCFQHVYSLAPTTVTVPVSFVNNVSVSTSSPPVAATVAALSHREGGRRGGTLDTGDQTGTCLVDLSVLAILHGLLAVIAHQTTNQPTSRCPLTTCQSCDMGLPSNCHQLCPRCLQFPSITRAKSSLNRISIWIC